jgi:hypothetical protein
MYKGPVWIVLLAIGRKQMNEDFEQYGKFLEESIVRAGEPTTLEMTVQFHEAGLKVEQWRGTEEYQKMVLAAERRAWERIKKRGD